MPKELRYIGVLDAPVSEEMPISNPKRALRPPPRSSLPLKLLPERIKVF